MYNQLEGKAAGREHPSHGTRAGQGRLGEGRGSVGLGEGAGASGIGLSLPFPWKVCPTLPLSFCPLLGAFMCLHMFAEVVTPHEDPAAHGAGELLGACVGLEVSLELIRPGEALAAEKPVADKGAVPTVPPQVGLQVGRLGISLATSRNVAVVKVLLLGTVWARSYPLSFLAVWAAAHSLTRAPWHGSSRALRPSSAVHGLLKNMGILRRFKLFDPFLAHQVLGRGQKVVRRTAELVLGGAIAPQCWLESPRVAWRLEATLTMLKVHPAGSSMKVPPGVHTAVLSSIAGV